MTTITVPVVVSIGGAAQVEVGVEVGVRQGDAVRDVGGERVVWVVDEDSVARSVAEALVYIAATMLDARGDALTDVVGVALDAFDD